MTPLRDHVKYRPRLAQLIILQSVLSITAMLLIALASQSGHDTVAGLGWRITVQRPLAPLQAQRLQWVQQVLLIVALPFGFVLFVSVMFLREISAPLRELASLIDVTDPLDGRPTSRARHAVLLRRLHSLSGWYQEAWLIKQALLRRIDMVRGSSRPCAPV